jgi:hypothetical protein
MPDSPPDNHSSHIPHNTPIQATDGHETIVLRRLTLPQLKRLDTSLEDVGEFGEVRLRVEKGAVRFVEVVVSRKI